MAKAILLSISLLISTSAFAGPRVVLDCDTPFGPTQQVRVLEQDGKLTFEELRTSGALRRRSLSQEEWKSGVIQMRPSEIIDQVLLKREKTGWWLQVISPGFKEGGYLHCEVE